MKIDGFEYPAVFIVFNQKKSFRMLFHERSCFVESPGFKGDNVLGMCWKIIGINDDGPSNYQV